jgi:SAM-dependent methyltransferase
MSRYTGDASIRIAGRVSTFFKERAEFLGACNSLPATEEDVAVAMLYGDREVALRRSRDEIGLIGPLLGVDSSTTVIDLGCGAGRWAEYLMGRVQNYVGVDPDANLTYAASRRLSADNVSFLHTDQRPVSNIVRGMRFHVALLAGIVHYLDDDELAEMLNDLLSIVPGGLVYIRGPFARSERLTLVDEWSDNLGTKYSAIYRSLSEFERIIPPSFNLIRQGNPFPGHQNRAETFQQYWIYRVG